MVVGEVASSTDVLVIGAGPGGYAAALRAAQLGKRVTLVEKDRVGGTCLNVGCIPSKMLIHAANIAGLGEEAAVVGVDLEASPDMERIQQHIAEVVGGLTSGVDSLLSAAGVDRVSGVARFTKENRSAVVSGELVRHFEFEEAIVATGSRPAELSELPFDGQRTLDSTGALALERVPSSLAVVGGGYIGVELGTAFAKLGAKVTVIELCDRLLPLLDASLGAVVERRLRALGVEILLGSQAKEMTESGLRVSHRGEDVAVAAEKILVAVGRVPRTDDLGLQAAGARVDAQGRVIVDEARRAARHVLAIGDLTAGPALAHKATAEAEVAALTAAGRRAAFDPATVPEIVFSDPEVASVGLTIAQAEEMGCHPRHFRFPLTASSRARAVAAPLGHVEVVADQEDTILGVHMAGPHVSELAGEAALAVEMGASLEDLALTIHPHPTLSEALGEAAWGALGRPLHLLSGRIPS